MRVRVIELTGEAPLVLQAQSSLESVVVAVGGVFFLVDSAVSLIGTVDVASGIAPGWPAPVASVRADIASILVASVTSVAADRSGPW